MNWRAQYTQAEIDEMYLDSCAAYNAEIINEQEFRKALGSLGYNATDIEETVRQHAPKLL